jgi:hypothetical protein
MVPPRITIAKGDDMTLWLLVLMPSFGLSIEVGQGL